MRRLHEVRLLLGLAGLTIGAPGAAVGQDGGVPHGDIAARSPLFLAVESAGDARRGSRWVDVSNAAVFRRRIKLELRGVSRERALAEIARQAGLQLTYSAAIVSLNTPVTLIAKDLTVGAALSAVLYDAGVDVLLTENGRAALMRRLVPVTPWRPGSVVGRVTDSAGQGLAGVEIFLERTPRRTTSDTAGWYRLAEVDSGSYVLVARRLGYAKLSRRVTVREDREDTVNVAMVPAAVPLNELVTTATGQQRRRDLGNAITTIQADSVLRNAPIKNLTDLLKNRVPGLTVQHTTGAPGDPAKLRLRGLGSAYRSNDPVVVVDGIRVYSAQSEVRSGNLTNEFGGHLSRPGGGIFDPTIGRSLSPGVPAPSPLDQIDPNIIEKIEVFKGPSAATLYGADAANGVIVITTKKGKPGPTRWRATVTHGRTSSPGRYPVGYYRWGHDREVSVPIFCTLLFTNCIQDSLVQFQALNERSLTVLGTGRRTGLSLTASGGTQALTYSLTGSYSDELGHLKLPAYEVRRFDSLFNRPAPDWMRRPHQYETWSVTSNVTARLSSTADVTLTTGLARSEQRRTSLENQPAALLGTYVDTVNGIYYRPNGPTSYPTSTADILRDYYVRTTASTITFTTGLNAQWRPRSWFTASGQAGLNVIPRDDQLLLPAGLVSLTDSGTVARGTGRALVSTTNVQGELRKPLGHGFVFTTSLGANLTTNATGDLRSQAQGLVPGTSSISGAKRILASEARMNTSVFGWYIEPRIAGQRLSLSTGLRLDGGSSYGARLTRTGGGLGLGGLLALPKLNGSWVVSEEPWFPFPGLFSSLRLRGAYGQAQVQPSPLDRLRIYSRDAQQSGLLTLTGVGNTHLKPERSTEFEGGFDADLLDGRVSLELTAYRKRQVDALMPLTLPPSVNGGGTVTTNIGNIQNTGLELSATVTPVRLPAVIWSAQLIYSRNRNILTKLGDGVAPQPLQGLVEGYPVGSRWARPILGFVDADNNGVLQRDEIQVGDSMVYLGRLLPAYTTALHTNVVLFGGAVGVTAGFSYDAGATQMDQTLTTNWVLERAFVDPSVPLSQQAAVLAFNELTRGGQVLSPATEYGLMQTVSTLRFQSLSINYRAPVKVARLLRAQQLTVAVQGDNLALHSSYRGKDPDVNVWSPGEGIADAGLLPQPRTWQLALYLEY